MITFIYADLVLRLELLPLSTGNPKPLKELLGGADTMIGRLRQRSADIDTLTAEVKCLLPDALGPHLLAASQRDSTLCLVTDAAVWAAKLRYLAPDILISLNRTQGRSLQKVKVGVAAQP